ncbi:hypothetical protein GFS60_06425 (plasmid) [Rhodococcus sp. WAY2]|nr:hypothetical protein GFS60_06425 [Rhodococcus sp. WAY2]
MTQGPVPGFGRAQVVGQAVETPRMRDFRPMCQAVSAPRRCGDDDDRPVAPTSALPA